MGIIWAILLFSFLILIHELGHFIAAKAFGVQVNAFALFMGPAILKKKIGETEYILGCVPFGGYCAMEGEDEDSDNPRAFSRAAWWKRLIILLAGVTMNAIIGIAMAIALMLPMRQDVVPVIDYVNDWSTLGGENGLQSGDRILGIDGEKIYIYDDFSMLLQLKPASTHDLLILRDGQELLLKDFPMEKQQVVLEDGTTAQLYGLNFTLRDMTGWDKIREGFFSAVSDVRMVRLSLAMLLSGGAGIKDVSGPVGIVGLVSDSTQMATSSMQVVLLLLRLGSLLSMNLAVMNLLPIPALDGGRAVCLLITAAAEKITGKKINPKYEGYLHLAGMILLLGLMAVITFKDIFVIVKG